MLPGQIVILSRDLVETPPDAETAAGHVIAARAAAATQDPVLPLLEHAGVVATFRLLTTGAMPEAAVSGYAETLLTTPQPTAAETDLLAAFTALDLSSAAYSAALHDPFPAGSPRLVLADDEWISLQGICAE